MTPPLAVVLQQVPLEDDPDSIMPPEQRRRMWALTVRDYIQVPALLRDAIEWRAEELAKPEGPRGGHDQLRRAVDRLTRLAEILFGGIPPHQVSA